MRSGKADPVRFGKFAATHELKLSDAVRRGAIARLGMHEWHRAVTAFARKHSRVPKAAELDDPAIWEETDPYCNFKLGECDDKGVQVAENAWESTLGGELLLPCRGRAKIFYADGREVWSDVFSMRCVVRATDIPRHALPGGKAMFGFDTKANPEMQAQLAKLEPKGRVKLRVKGAAVANLDLVRAKEALDAFSDNHKHLYAYAFGSVRSLAPLAPLAPSA